MPENYSIAKRKVHSLTTVTVVSHLIVLVILKYAFGEHFGIIEALISAAVFGIVFFPANHWRLKKEQKKARRHRIGIISTIRSSRRI